MPLPTSPPPAAASALELVLIGAAAALAVVLLMMWLRERHVGRARAARRSDEVDRELGAVAQLSASLADARDADQAARLLVDAVFTSIGVDFAAVALVDEQAQRARGLVARGRPEVEEWWPSMRVHLDSEPSAIAATVQAPRAARHRRRRRLPDRQPAPGRAGGREERRLRSRARGRRRRSRARRRARAGPARRRGGARPARRARRRDGARARARRIRRRPSRTRWRASGSSRASAGASARSSTSTPCCASPSRSSAAPSASAARSSASARPARPCPCWPSGTRPTRLPVGDEAPRLPALNLAAARAPHRARRGHRDGAARSTIPRSATSTCCGASATRAVLATPIVVFDRVDRRLRPPPATRRRLVGRRRWRWPRRSRARPASRSTRRACSRTTAAASSSRPALLEAAAVVTGELRLEPVLDRLVGELVKLLRADAADCFIDDPARGGAALRGRARPRLRGDRLAARPRVGALEQGARAGADGPLGRVRAARAAGHPPRLRAASTRAWPRRSSGRARRAA